MSGSPILVLSCAPPSPYLIIKVVYVQALPDCQINTCGAGIDQRCKDCWVREVSQSPVRSSYHSLAHECQHDWSQSRSGSGQSQAPRNWRTRGSSAERRMSSDWCNIWGKSSSTGHALSCSQMDSRSGKEYQRGAYSRIEAGCAGLAPCVSPQSDVQTFSSSTDSCRQRLVHYLFGQVKLGVPYDLCVLSRPRPAAT